MRIGKVKNYFVIQVYKFIVFIVTEKAYFVNQVYKICFSGCFLKKTCVYWLCMNMTVTPKLIERQNQNNIISYVERGRISRAEIAKQTGLSRTTVSNACSRLLDLHLVQEEVLPEESVLSRGRPGTPLSLTEDCWYAAGATLIDRELLFVLLRLSGKVACQFSLPLKDLGPETYLQTLAEGFARILHMCPDRLLPCLGVGSPGLINNGKVLHASDMGWSDLDISGYLQEQLGIKAEVINRHWASCLCEYNHLSVGSMIYVGISTGIAAAIIADGKLFTGAYHSAGEIGHTVVCPNGPICTCGRRGCLHAMSSETFIVRHVEEQYQHSRGPLFDKDPLWDYFSAHETLPIENICQAARQGHPLAQNMLEQAALYLGLSISNLASMFNPECVVLGGSLVEHGGPEFVRHIFDSVHQYSSSDTMCAVKFLTWSQGRISGAVGAARLVLDRKIELAAQALKSHTPSEQNKPQSSIDRS